MTKNRKKAYIMNRIIAEQNVLFLVSLPLFKRTGNENNKQKKGGRASNDGRKAQANELKSIINEMIGELQDQQRSRQKPVQGSFPGRSKEMSDYQTVFNEREKMAKEYQKRLENAKTAPVVESKDAPALTVEDLEKSWEYPDDMIKNVHYDQREYPKNEEVKPIDIEIEKPRQPRVRPTEEGVIEFDESKYFHESKPKPIVEEEPEDTEPEIELVSWEKPKRKKDLQIKKHKKADKIKYSKKTRADHSHPDDVDIDEELRLLNDLLGMIDRVKRKPKKMGNIIDKLENIVTDYRATEKDIDDSFQHKTIEELEEVREIILSDDRPAQTKHVEDETFEELEELDEPDDVEELEELEELDELEELEEFEELEEPEDKERVNKFNGDGPLDKRNTLQKQKKSKKKKKKKIKSKHKKSKKELDEFEELEEFEEIE